MKETKREKYLATRKVMGLGLIIRQKEQLIRACMRNVNAISNQEIIEIKKGKQCIV